MSTLRSNPRQSKREGIVTTIQQTLRNLGEGNYVVVQGDKGVGKTCAIETALHRKPGVVHVRIAPGTLEDDIMSKVSAQLAKISATFINPLGSARRVIAFYRLMTFGRCPIVVLQVSERTAGKHYAELTGAVRSMTQMGLQVIVDASPNAVPPDLLSSQRQDIITVDHMSNDLILSEFPDLFQAMDAVKLRHVALAVVGGVPAAAIRLRAEVLSASNQEEMKVTVYKFVKDELSKAIKQCEDAVRHQPKMDNIMKEFIGSALVPYTILRQQGVEPPSPDKILRAVERSGEMFLVPATAATQIVLYHGLTKVPPLDELRSMLRTSYVRC